MPIAKTAVQTEKASRYLQQLCKHFAHKVEVEFTPEQGLAKLPGGDAHMQAGAETLSIRIEADSPEGLARAKYIVEDHLLRFAFRENLGPLTWTD